MSHDISSVLLIFRIIIFITFMLHLSILLKWRTNVHLLKKTNVFHGVSCLFPHDCTRKQSWSVLKEELMM